MIPYLGDFAEDATVYIMFNTFSSDDPSASCTITNFANTDVHIHKDDGLTQRNNAAGITVSVDFDGITGSHLVKIDTSDDTVAGFWVVGHEYFVRIEGTTIDAATVNSVIGQFSIENRFNEVDVVKWLGTAAATPTVAGVPEVDVTHIGGAAQSATDLKDFADEGYNPATNKVTGVLLTDTCTTTTTTTNLTNAATNGDLTATMKTSVNTEADTAFTDYDPPTKTEMDTAFTEIKGATWAAGTDTLEHIRDKETDIETDTAEIGAAGAGLTDLGGMSTGMKAEIESEANDALVAQKLDHLVAVADADDVVDNSIIAKLASKGATADWSTFVNTTDALEAIRDRGDAAWTTGAGGSPPTTLQNTTIATLASQTSFTLTAGSTDDHAYKGAIIVVEDSVTATQKAVGRISAYTGATKTVTLQEDPGVFSMAAGDTVDIIADDKMFIDYTTAKAAFLDHSIATVDGVCDGIQTDLSNATDGLGALKSLIDAVDSKVVTVDTVVDGIQTDLSNATDGLGALKTLIDTVQTDLDNPAQYKADVSSLALEATLTDIKGATFAGATDSLEAIRDRGDAAWTTGAGGSDRLLMVDTTIATLATQTGFTLTAGSADDDAYNNCTIVIEDASTATQKAVGIISDYTGGSKTVTLKYDPAIFTMAPSDKVYILAENALKATLANRQLNVAADGDIAGNIDGSVASVVGHTAQTGDSYAIVNNASYGNAKLVRSTAPANALDVSATGEAGLDFANIKNATGAHTLTNITVPTVSTLTGHTAQTGDNFARLGAPAGASVSADILTIDNFVDELENRLTAARAGYLDNLSAGAVALASGVDLTSIHGSALTETVNGYLAAGFVKLFDVATPLLVASSAMRGTNSAALAATALSDAVWTNAKAAFLDHSIATVDGNVDTLVTRIPDTISLANINGEVDTALSDIKLDHLVNIAVDTDWATTVHLDSVIGQLADVGTAATFDRTTDALEALRSRGDAAWVTATGFNTTTPPTVTQIRQEMDANSTKMAPSQVLADYKATGFSTHSAADVKTAIEAAGSSIAQILADTDELQTNQGNWVTATGFSTHSAADVKTAIEAAGSSIATILADTNELQTDWANGGRLDLLIDAILLDTGTTLDALVKRILGLEQENVFIDNTTYAGVHMTGARVRIYSVAGSVGTVNDVIATYTMTASYTGDEMDDYKVVKS